MNCALGYPKIKEIIRTRCFEISTEKGNILFFQNTNKLLWSDKEVVAGKTGYTRRAGNCFVGVAERRLRTVIVAILGSPNREDLWQEAEALIAKGFRVIENNEDPTIYLTKGHYNGAVGKKTLRAKHSRSKSKRGPRKTAANKPQT